jgi:hypothetical protein
VIAKARYWEKLRDVDWCQSYASSPWAAAAGRKLRTSPWPASDLSQNFFPGYADRPLSLQVVEAAVEFFALLWRQRNILGSLAEAIPKLLKQPKPLLCTHVFDVHKLSAHEARISQRRIRSE